MALSSSAHLCGKHMRILGAGVAGSSQNNGLTEPRRPKLFQEGDAFLSSGDSSEPVGLAFLHLLRQRLAQYYLGGVNRATFSDDPR